MKYKQPFKFIPCPLSFRVRGIGVGFFSSAYLDQCSRHDKYYKINFVDQAKYYEINVGHTQFQPTWISHPH